MAYCILQMVYRNKSKKFLKLFFYSYLLFTICYLLNGCATAPHRGQLVTYSIGGISYVPLIPLCQAQGISWEYDTFTKTVNLNKDAHKISFAAGDRLVLVDGSALHLKHPTDIYQGTVVVPVKFKEQILDVLFKEERRVSPGRQTGGLSLKIKTIIIDAGHGGRDPGTIGRTGLKEKVVTLDIAKRLAVLLKADGFNAVMTRSSDTFVPLARRVAIANDAQADLFISIHANANRVRSLNGFEAYYVSSDINDYRRPLYAAENAVLNLDSSCFSQPSPDLKAILWDMIYTDNRAESVKLSEHICRIVNSNLNARILGIKYANFYVLKGTHMPAVLVEIGFLSNHNDERRIRNSYYRQQVAVALAEGIENYTKDHALTQAYNYR